MSGRKVLLISLGGTITMTRTATGGIAPSLNAADLVRAVVGIENVADIETVSPLSMPGASLSIDNIVGVAALIDARLGDDVDGVVVIQGTDTIEETAFLFDLLVCSERPVVVTGAMRGAEAPGADGPANVLAATIVAAARDANGLGTLVVMNDEIHAARFVQKSHTALPSAFTSPLGGPLGIVVEGRARIHSRPVRQRQPIVAVTPADAPVALIQMSLGDDGRMLSQMERLGYRGVVLEGMGAGHVPSIVAPIISDLVKAMPVILATRVHTGPAFTSTYGFPGSEIDLLHRGAISAGDLSSLKARLLLSILLRNGADRNAIAAAFDVARPSAHPALNQEDRRA
ncbi:MAG: asparaginase [Betaproteobacteria bacterium]